MAIAAPSAVSHGSPLASTPKGGSRGPFNNRSAHSAVPTALR